MMTKFCESIHGDNWMITDLGKLWPQFNGHGPGFSWQVGSCWSSIYLSTSAVQYLQGTFSWGQISKWRSSESRKCDPGQPLGHSRRRNEQVSWCLSLEPCSPTHEQPTFVHFIFNSEMTELRGMLMFNVCSLIGSRFNLFWHRVLRITAIVDYPNIALNGKFIICLFRLNVDGKLCRCDWDNKEKCASR